MLIFLKRILLQYLFWELHLYSYFYGKPQTSQGITRVCYDVTRTMCPLERRLTATRASQSIITQVSSNSSFTSYILNEVVYHQCRFNQGPGGTGI